MEKMTGDLSMSRLAVVMAEAAKTSGKSDITGLKDTLPSAMLTLCQHIQVRF
jgi:hypothetical protein